MTDLGVQRPAMVVVVSLTIYRISQDGEPDLVCLPLCCWLSGVFHILPTDGILQGPLQHSSRSQSDDAEVSSKYGSPGYLATSWMEGATAIHFLMMSRTALTTKFLTVASRHIERWKAQVIAAASDRSPPSRDVAASLPMRDVHQLVTGPPGRTAN
ncbi:uncharacterized protein LOC117887874 isoform X2 [Trachemys scripta elegans]|uniref:uncharacterized protein LOC117887874 isoform X2 n=1 Tax=Trachemys scripta elegans TaxID=31138 RepID=UPI0015576016|nr:uncharacterized protein LOC117887874 isoform X2 [Trachemys scripta elegans]